MNPSFRKFTIITLAGILLVLAANAVYFHNFTELRFLDPSRLALVDVRETIGQPEKRIVLFDRDDPATQRIIEMSYGPYKNFISTSDLPLSVASEGEFTLPHAKLNGKPYFIREHPELRYRLWKFAPPDFVLMGSSMMFQNFNRSVYLQRYPGRYLIDFCMGDNTPFLTGFMLNKLDDCRLWFKPGSTVVYGLNTYELMQGYLGKTREDVIKALSAVDNKSIKKSLKGWLRLTLRTQGPKYLAQKAIRKVRIGNRSYMKPVAKELSRRPKMLREILMGNLPQNRPDKRFPINRAQLRRLSIIMKMVELSEARFILVLVPSSSLDERAHGTFVQDLSHTLAKVCKQAGAEYYDLWDHQKTGIDDRDFLVKGSAGLYLNPQHLNYDGSVKFTNRLLDIISNAQASVRP